MQTIECKEVQLWDGGERHNFGFFINKDVSDEAIKNANPHCMIFTKLITIFENLNEVNENSIRELRKSAWKKLSPQERLALNMLEEPK